MRSPIDHLVLFVVLFVSMASVSAADADRSTLRRSLTFHAPFDDSLDARFANGDPRLHTAPGGKFLEGQPGVSRPDVSIDAGSGRHGEGALRIDEDSSDWLFFRGDRNVAYREKDWSLTVSMWMRVDPVSGLPPGYVDPLQVTDKRWNDASIFLDWDQEPRDFRLGTFADDGVWNADGRKFEDLARDERPMVRLPAADAPFAADRWTHVALTLSGFNVDPASSAATLWIDGKRVGSLAGRAQTFTWDPARVAILLGIRYVGWIDDFAIFDRALSEDEIHELVSLEHGVADLFPGEGALRVRIVDATTGEPTTAMACLTSLEDGSVRLPPRGEVSRRPSTTRAFYAGQDDSRAISGRIGPVRKMAGEGDNDDRSFVYELDPSIPYWREPVSYQVAASFVTALPAGRYRLSLARGMEFVPVDHEVTIEAGRATGIDVTLERWAYLAAEGWFSGDVHVHHPALTERHRDFLIGYAEAEDLNLVNVLEMGHHEGTDFRQEGFGPSFRRQRGNYAIAAGQEEPRSTFGHIIGLNTRSLVRDLSTYELYDIAFRRIHEQPGALVGYAHFAWNGCALPRGFPWYVTTGEVDFVELMQFARVNADEYRDLLDLGFRIAAAAGSDVPWGSTIGECRTYVYTGGASLDIDAWFDGLAKGRTFVSNGPIIDLRVGDERPGAVIEIAGAASVRITAVARGHERVGLPQELVVRTVGGGVSRAVAQGGAPELRLEAEIALRESAWFTAEVRCTNGAIAHTSPIWVEIGGLPARSASRGPEIIDRLLASIAVIEQEFADGDDERSRAILERLARAKSHWTELKESIAASAR